MDVAAREFFSRMSAIEGLWLSGIRNEMECGHGIPPIHDPGWLLWWGFWIQVGIVAGMHTGDVCACGHPLVFHQPEFKSPIRGMSYLEFEATAPAAWSRFFDSIGLEIERLHCLDMVGAGLRFQHCPCERYQRATPP